jgi:NAD+ synthase
VSAHLTHETLAGLQSKGFNPSLEIMRITNFIKSYVGKSEMKGVTLGISGGIDSAVVAFLCTKAIGPSRVTGVLLFEDEFRGSKDYSDAKKIISQLHINSLEFPISALVKAFSSTLRQGHLPQSKITLANIKARIRMVLLYAVANEKRLLVVGTGDRSEEEIGYFTKYGDGGVDFMPMAHLYKTQVRELGRKLGVPERIVEKPSSPNLWKKHRATDELPADYPELDRILSLLYDSRESPSQVSKALRVPARVVREVMRRHEETAHKREYPPMLPK